MNAALASPRIFAWRAIDQGLNLLGYRSCGSIGPNKVLILCSASLHWDRGKFHSTLAQKFDSSRTLTSSRSQTRLIGQDISLIVSSSSKSNFKANFYSCGLYKHLKQSRSGLETVWHTFAYRLFGTATDSSGTTMSVPRSDTEKSPFVVGHDSKQKMFYVELKDKAKTKKDSLAKLEYEWVRPGLVDLHHTETPPAFQGQGIAKILVLAGLDHFC